MHRYVIHTHAWIVLHMLADSISRMHNTLQKRHSRYTFKLLNPRHRNLCEILYRYACKYLCKWLSTWRRNFLSFVEALPQRVDMFYFVMSKSMASQFLTSVTSTIVDSINSTRPQSWGHTFQLGLMCACPFSVHWCKFTIHCTMFMSLMSVLKVTTYWILKAFCQGRIDLEEGTQRCEQKSNAD